MTAHNPIYAFLTSHAGSAADDALLLALDRAQPPYDLAILDTLLHRSRPHAMARLLERFPQLPRLQKRLLLQRADKLAAGLFRAARAPEPATRITALQLIRHARLLRLAELAALLLRDPQRRIADLAATTLLDLARYTTRRNTNHPALTATHAGRSHPLDADHDRLLAACQTALNSFSAHHRLDAVHAAMVLVPANNPYFWHTKLQPYAPLGRAVRHLLLENNHPLLASFALTALAHPSLRPTAARAIAIHQSPPYLAQLALAYHRFADDNIRQGLKLVRQPRWLAAPRLPFQDLAPNEQTHLLHLIRDLPLTPDEQLHVLELFATHAAPRPATHAAHALAQLPQSLAHQALPRLALASAEPTALTALAHLRRRDYPQLRSIALQLLRSPHPRLQQWARSFLAGFLFTRFWQNFPTLDEPHRQHAARALFKADHNALARWEKLTHDANPAHRLRAVQVARLASVVDQCLPALTQLTRDQDPRVRSCAAAALGQSNHLSPDATTQLLHALADPDPRVRANSIEAIETSQGPDFAPHLLPFLQDPHNRVRANAIKAMLRWKVQNATQAIQHMLHDPRPPHRRSAQWVLNNLKTPDYLALAAASQTSPLPLPLPRRMPEGQEGAPSAADNPRSASLLATSAAISTH